MEHRPQLIENVLDGKLVAAVDSHYDLVREACHSLSYATVSCFVWNHVHCLVDDDDADADEEDFCVCCCAGHCMGSVSSTMCRLGRFHHHN